MLMTYPTPKRRMILAVLKQFRPRASVSVAQGMLDS